MVIINKLALLLIINEFLSLKSCLCSEIYKPQVAIVGAGIGGASTSHFLIQLFKKNVHIDILESKEIGGRLATVKFKNEEFEAGGSIIHSKNKYMKYFVDFLKLKPKKPLPSNLFGIWNGENLLYTESNWKLFSLLKLVYQYGFQPISLHHYIGTVLNDFDKIYYLQNQGIGYENVTSLLHAMNSNFINLLQISIKDHLTQMGYGKKIIDELVEAALVVNYGQDTNVHAFVACVSVAGAGYDLWSVKGGNKKVPELLILNNKQISIIYSTVKKIVRHAVGEIPKYEIFYKENGKEKIDSKMYDIVILAMPMTNDQDISQVQFVDFKNSNLSFMGEFQTTYATFVEGEVNASYFGFTNEFGGIMSCNLNKTKISSIGRLFSVEGTKNINSQIWKVFSREKLTDALMNKIFTKVNHVKEFKWKAYPKYATSIRDDRFKLDNSMYYVNAIEWAASAMEMSAISGRNVANLAFHDFKKHDLYKNMRKQETQTHSSEL